ncbi:MAG: SGNH/GDSL hydrolase family protein [Hyphomicrobiaceae bacterium]|nr:MAG: SGNH/GDSL hydrolase family protein [Hyphomicrobiaceae bacterium]
MFSGLRVGLPTVGGLLTSVGPLTLFDTAAGDQFTALQYSGTDPSLTIAAGQITQNSSSVLNITASVMRGGVVINHCVDNWSVTATVRLNSWPVNARGLYVGAPTYNGFFHGGEVCRHGGSSVYALHRSVLNGSPWANGANYSIAGAPSAVLSASRNKEVLTTSINYAGSGNTTINDTLVFASTTLELPRMFSNFGLNFGSGQIDVLSLKVTAEYANARFAFVGDSITQGRFATTYADGFASIIRASYPTTTLIAGAPSATSGDWTSRIASVTMMTPRRAFIMLGTNDIGIGVTLATWQSNMTTIINALEAAGSSVVLVSIPPRGYSPVRTQFNAWLQTLGRPYIDIYTPLATGDALNATYDHGDGVHPNTAGHAVIASTIQAAITANGW